MLVLNYPTAPPGRLRRKSSTPRLSNWLRKEFHRRTGRRTHPFDFPRRALSFLQVPGAMDVGVEVHSMSKGFDMNRLADWMGLRQFKIVQAFADVKDNCDSGQFAQFKVSNCRTRCIQVFLCLSTKKYHRRLGKLVATLKECGFQCSVPGGSYFLYTKSPKGVKGGPNFANAEEASILHHRALFGDRALG